MTIPRASHRSAVFLGLSLLALAGCGSDPPGSGGQGGTSGSGGAGGATGRGGSSGGSGGAGGASATGGGGGSGAATGGATGATGGTPGTGGATGGTAGAGTGGTGGSAGSGGSAGTGGAGGGQADGGSVDMAPPADAPPTTGNNPAPGAYGTRATLPERNSEFAITALDGKVYVLGGYPTSPAQTRPTLQIYDTATNTWKLGMPSPVALHHPMIAGVNGKLYSLGGQPNTNLTLEYDPVADRWTEKARMPTSRGGGAAAVIGTKIYVVGARPDVAAAADNAFEVYDVATNMWATLPKLPPPGLRNHLAAVAIDGKVYVAGGRYNECCVGAPMTNALHMFDPGTNMWTQKANMRRPRGGVAGVAANGCFHVFGGEGSNIGEPNGVFPDHDVYNPKTDTWTAAPRLPIPFHGVTGGAFVDGVIYMAGGGTSSGGSSGTTMHQVFRPSTNCQ
jgi:N-acetylneuraminic acid mutarotase